MSPVRLGFLVNFFLFSLFFFTFFASGMIDSQDGFQYVAIARRMYYDHSFELPPEEFPDNNIHMSKTSATQRYSPTGLGYSLAMMPAVIAEDAFLRIAGRERISGFPLNADWPVLLFASMTNAFFGAVLTTTLYAYLRLYNIAHKQAMILGFIGVICTNLFVYTKHVYPHMMFTAFLVLSFYCVKRYSIERKRLWMLFAGMAYGVVILTYNQTFLLSIPGLGLYYLLLGSALTPRFSFIKIWSQLKKKRFSSAIVETQPIIKNIVLDVVIGVLGILPFWLLYSWFNTVRFGDPLSAGYGAGIPIPLIPPAYAIFEGIWGLLFSPGRSIFVYSPILLGLAFFWWKLEKKLLPEIISFSLLTLIYVIFFGTLMGSPTFMVWHGEMSWGNRYMVAILPLLWILLANIFVHLSKAEKLFVFIPLLLIGLYIQVVGVLLPYQIKIAGMPQNLYVTADKETPSLQYNYGEYPNFLPRFSAVYVQSKTLVKRLRDLPEMYNHGKFDLRLFDGFEAPFDIGTTSWRGIRPISQLSFKKTAKVPNEMTLLLRNHVMDPTSSRSATLVYTLNGHPLTEKTQVLANQEIEAKIKLPEDTLIDKNILRIDLAYTSTPAATIKKQQVVFLQGLLINNQHQNIQTMDYPFYSPISQSINNSQYMYWGGVQRELWDFWHLHSRVFEQTFDIWWLRPFHYWDMPKDFFAGLFAINALGIIYFGMKALKDTQSE
jgi:hypothetical protein